MKIDIEKPDHTTNPNTQPVNDSVDWLVRPFIRWGDGYYGLCVQAGVVTESPDQDNAWKEYHLEYRGGDIWELEVCPHENTGWTVWRGKIPTREIFKVVMTHTENPPPIDWATATDDGQSVSDAGDKIVRKFSDTQRLNYLLQFILIDDVGDEYCSMGIVVRNEEMEEKVGYGPKESGGRMAGMIRTWDDDIRGVIDRAMSAHNFATATDDGQRRDALTILAEHESRYQTDGFRTLIASIRHDIISSQNGPVSGPCLLAGSTNTNPRSAQKN